jgi:signal transduction histidine kinase
MAATLPAMEPAPPLNTRERLLRLFGRKLWLSFAFLFTSFPIGVSVFVLLVTFGSMGLGLLITIVGLPLVALTVWIWISAAKLERFRVRMLLGEPIPAPYRPTPEMSTWKRCRIIMTDPAVWRDLLYDILLFPLCIVEFVIAVFAIGFPATLLAAPIIAGTSSGGMDFGLWTFNTWYTGLLLVPIGIIALFPAALAVHFVAGAHREVAKFLLGPSDRTVLEKRVDTLTRTRTSVVEAMLAERRRIERDLHDGVQQHLVHLAMMLGMAKEKIDTDPEEARRLVGTAHNEAKQTISDLRNTVRGIHPAVLTNRGLDASISAVASASTIPTSVSVLVPERFSPAVESTAYFVVTEALSNIAKHSGATAAAVSISGREDALIVVVTDNGRGGADPRNGTGLIGLASRVEALDGRLLVNSPIGGPTTLTAEIPCES